MFTHKKMCMIFNTLQPQYIPRSTQSRQEPTAQQAHYSHTPPPSPLPPPPRPQLAQGNRGPRGPPGVLGDQGPRGPIGPQVARPAPFCANTRLARSILSSMDELLGCGRPGNPPMVLSGRPPESARETMQSAWSGQGRADGGGRGWTGCGHLRVRASARASVNLCACVLLHVCACVA